MHAMHARHAARRSVRIDPAHLRHVINRFDSDPRRVHPTFNVSDLEPRMTCSHVDSIRVALPHGKACDECVLMGDTWSQLRMCMGCGHIGCCDSSKNQHAIAHFQATHHPIARSIEPGEEWAWCYVDRLWFEKLVLR